MTYFEVLDQDLREVFPEISAEIPQTIAENWCPYQIFGCNAPYDGESNCCDDCDKCWYR